MMRRFFQSCCCKPEPEAYHIERVPPDSPRPTIYRTVYFRERSRAQSLNPDNVQGEGSKESLKPEPKEEEGKKMLPPNEPPQRALPPIPDNAQGESSKMSPKPGPKEDDGKKMLPPRDLLLSHDERLWREIYERERYATVMRKPAKECGPNQGKRVEKEGFTPANPNEFIAPPNRVCPF